MNTHQTPTGRFEGRAAIVTGGTDGIGRAVVDALLDAGARVAVVGLDADVEAARPALSQAMDRCRLIAGDLSEERFCRRVVAETLEHFGRVDCLVNNAFSFVAKGLDATRDDWLRSYSVGPWAFAALIQAVADPMRAQGGGSIVNVSSISAAIAQPNRWTYNTAKGAVAQLTRCAALDLAPFNIRVNSVSPGWIWTREVDKAAGGDHPKHEPIWGQFHMLRRLGKPDEVAAPILFLLGDGASFITGTDLPVDGGYNGLGPEGLGQNTKIAGSR